MNSPTPFNPISVADFIAARQVQVDKTDRQISNALGFKSSTMFELIKQGKAKLPMHHVIKLAEELSLDPADFLRQVMTEAMPDVLKAVDTAFHTMPMTAAELKLIDSVRYLSKGNDTTPLVIDGSSIIALVAM